jgi:hypothetical protein
MLRLGLPTGLAEHVTARLGEAEVSSEYRVGRRKYG